MGLKLSTADFGYQHGPVDYIVLGSTLICKVSLLAFARVLERKYCFCILSFLQ